MAKYTYTIFDGAPGVAGGTAWPTHEQIPIEAGSDDDAYEAVDTRLEKAATQLCVTDGYKPGNVIHAIIWREDGAIVGSPTHELTADELGVDKSDARQWETVATYVDTFSDDSELGEGAVDVDVQVGHCGSAWFIRTRDDAGGNDDAPDDVYDSYEAAVVAAEVFAAWHNEAKDDEDAEDYLRRRRAEKAEAENEDA